jgi:diguanylate cyclase (GGDEF)-like protein/PAS domain S-box-containing protein
MLGHDVARIGSPERGVASPPARPNDELLVAIVESSSDAIVAKDLEGAVTGWNRAAERLYGWRADEITGRSIDLVVPEDRRDEVAMIRAAIRRGERVAPIETERLTKTGTRLRVRVHESPILDREGRLVGASTLTHDIGEHHRMREALAASEARYRALVDTVSEFVIVTDGDGLADEAQPSWSAFTGQDIGASTESGRRAAVHPDDRAAFDASWSAGVKSKRAFVVSCRIRNSSGEYRYCEGNVVPLRDDHGRVLEWVAAVADVHERHEVQERQRTSAERFQRFVDSNILPICYGEEDHILDGNRAFLDLLGIQRRDLERGHPLSDLLSPKQSHEGMDVFHGGDAAEYEFTRADGTSGYVLVAGVSLEPEPGWIAVAVDLTERRTAEDDARRLSLHDPLTGLPNRRLLLDRIDRALARDAAPDEVVGVLFCDLDHFKQVNDEYGHAVGDQLLHDVADRLAEQGRGGDTVARVGGDEFVIVLEGLTGPGDATRIAERMRASLEHPIHAGGQDLRVTCSIGVAVASGHTRDVDALLERADAAMYRAKQRGRNRVEVDVTEDVEISLIPMIDLRTG